MRSVFTRNSIIRDLTGEIAGEMGKLSGLRKMNPNFTLRRANKVRSIQASLAMEGSKLTVEQISSLWDGNDNISASQKEIDQAKNAIEVYSNLSKINPDDMKDLMKCYGILMKNLTDNNVRFRANNEEISDSLEMISNSVTEEPISESMKEIFDYLNEVTFSRMAWMVRSCIIHYEFLTISPFKVGNGVMSRLWQKLVFMKTYPVFEFMSVEAFVTANQKEYYKALRKSEKIKASTPFVEFYLRRILEAIKDYAKTPKLRNDTIFRLESAKSHFGDQWFRRREYLSLYGDISESTSSRDLGYGVEESLLIHDGKHNQVKYKFLT